MLFCSQLVFTLLPRKYSESKLFSTYGRKLTIKDLHSLQNTSLKKEVQSLLKELLKLYQFPYTVLEDGRIYTTDLNTLPKVETLSDESIQVVFTVSPKYKFLRNYLNKWKEANSRGIEFMLTQNQYRKLTKQTHCFYTGVKFEAEGDNKISIDRIDNVKGYVDGNVVACTCKINKLKQSLFESGLHDKDQLFNLFEKLKETGFFNVPTSSS